MNEELDDYNLLKKVIMDIDRFDQTINRYMNDIPEFLNTKFLHLEESEFLNLQNEIEFHYKEILHFRSLKFNALKDLLNHLKTKKQ